jgi:poly[(R)-3-hydroxyalkanoate] polymerase subunit PhaC
MTAPADHPARETAQTQAHEAAGPLDLLLPHAAAGALGRFRPEFAALRLAAQLARRPAAVAKQAGWLAAELWKVAEGTSQITPAPRDRRFADPAWRDSPLLRRIVQGYLAGAQASGALLADAELDWQDSERMRFLLMNLVAAAAPSNNPLISPVGWKAALDTGGLSAVRGIRALISDLATAPRIPSMVAADAFTIGRDLAVTPGAVVARSELFELIQYEPSTAMVRGFPLLIVPPMINKFYITDLAPGRSMVEFLAGQGFQVFVISWRNPDRRHRDWDLDAYGNAVLDALGAVRSIAKAPKASVMGLCAGGLITSMVGAHLSRTGQLGQIASLCLGVTVLDQAHAGMAAALIDEPTARAATLASSRLGYLDGRTLAEVFAWLRPDDLIWNYWVNNYLQGQPPPPFDILYWNADTTRLPAALHHDFLSLALSNALTRPDEATMLGSPVDLGRVDVDSYVVAGIADHIVPWQSAYRSTQLLGGPVRFVLSTSGHIASMVNPPGNPKSTFRIAPENPAEPGEWLAGAATQKGSWWTDYSAWLAERSGGEKKRPARLGSKQFPSLGPAPGSYVLDR